MVGGLPNACSTFLGTSDLTGQNPQLGPLQDNGGPTWTHAIPKTSPAYNAGDDRGCPATDQRGMTRVPTCDIGAYEYVMQVYLPLALRN